MPDKPDEIEGAREEIRRALRHDLRGPLSVVLGRCEMLLAGTYGPLEPEHQRNIEIIHRNAERLLGSIDALGDRVDAYLG